jgi:hypothetical protein
LMREYLTGSLRVGIEEIMKRIGLEEQVQTANDKDVERAKGWAQLGGYGKGELSDEDTDDEEYQRGRTAHALFCTSQDNLGCSLSPASLDALADRTNSVTSTPTQRLLPTPETSPGPWHRRIAPHKSRQSEATSTGHHEHSTRIKTENSGPLILPANGVPRTPPKNIKPEQDNSSRLSSPLKKRHLSPSVQSSPKRARNMNPDDTPTATNAIPPPTPRTLARRRQREIATAERKKMAERLARALPHRVVNSYAKRTG